MVPGNDHRNTKRVGRREIVYLPLNKPESVYLRTRPSLSVNFFVLPFILTNKKRKKEKKERKKEKIEKKKEEVKRG